MKRKRPVDRIFTHLLSSYLVVLMVPLMFIGIISDVAGRAMRQNIIETNQAMLVHSMNAIEDKFNVVRRVIMTFNRQKDVGEFIRMPSTDLGFIARSISLRSQINDIRMTQEIIDKIYIYSTYNKLFFSTSGVIDMQGFLRDYYANTALNVNNMPALLADSHMGAFLPLSHISQYPSAADNAPEGNRIFKDQITYVQTLPIAPNTQYDGAVLVLLNAGSVTSMLNTGMLGGGSVAIVDETGRKLVEILGSGEDGSPAYRIGYGTALLGDYTSDTNIVAQVTSPTTRWTYMASMPQTQALATLNSIARTGVVLIAAALFISVGLSFYLSRHNALPFLRMSRLVRGLDGGTPEGIKGRDRYNGLVEAVSRLVDSNRAMHVTLQKQTDLLTSSFFNRLLADGFEDTAEIHAYLSHLKISFSGGAHMVVHIRLLPGVDQADLPMTSALQQAADTVEQAAAQILYGSVNPYRQDMSNLFLFYSPWHDGPDDRRNALIADNMAILYNHLQHHMELKFHMAVGGLYAGIKDVAMSAKEAQRALRSCELERGQSMLLWYDDRQNRDVRQHPYSLVFEQHLINQIKIGNRAKVEELLAGFYENTLLKAQYSYRTLDIIKHELVSTLIRAMQEACYDAPVAVLDDISFDDDMQTFFARVTAAAAALCDNRSPEAPEGSASLADAIIGYIHKNLHDPNLSHIHACDHFHISRYHLNKFVQEKTAVGFTDYVEGLRMQTAVDLLEHSDLSIHDIAGRTGYQNDKTFRRAFKRSFGYSPSDRRLRERVAPDV